MRARAAASAGTVFSGRPLPALGGQDLQVQELWKAGARLVSGLLGAATRLVFRTRCADVRLLI